MQGRWLFPIKAAGTGTPTVFEKTPMSDGPMSTVRWVDMAVAPSGNVQLILDIFNKTGVPAYVSGCARGPYCRCAMWPWTRCSSSRLWPAWPRAADGRRR